MSLTVELQSTSTGNNAFIPQLMEWRCPRDRRGMAEQMRLQELPPSPWPGLTTAHSHFRKVEPKQVWESTQQAGP